MEDLEKLAAYFDARYVLKDACSDRHAKTESEIKEIALAQERNTTQLSFISKVGIASLTTGISILAAQICSLIFK